MKITECHYCQAALPVRPEFWGQGSNNQSYNLDRMDNSKGYHVDNLVVACVRCNYGKKDLFTYEEWYGMTEYLRRKKQ